MAHRSIPIIDFPQGVGVGGLSQVLGIESYYWRVGEYVFCKVMTIIAYIHVGGTPLISV